MVTPPDTALRITVAAASASTNHVPSIAIRAGVVRAEPSIEKTRARASAFGDPAVSTMISRAATSVGRVALMRSRGSTGPVAVTKRASVTSTSGAPGKRDASFWSLWFSS